MLLLEKIYHLHLKQIVVLLDLDHKFQFDLHYKHHHRHLMYYFLVDLEFLLHHHYFPEADLLEEYYLHLLQCLVLFFLHRQHLLLY